MYMYIHLFIYSVSAESDSLEDDRLSGRLPDSEQREDASEPPSNGT